MRPHRSWTPRLPAAASFLSATLTLLTLAATPTWADGPGPAASQPEARWQPVLGQATGYKRLDRPEVLLTGTLQVKKTTGGAARDPMAPEATLTTQPDQPLDLRGDGELLGRFHGVTVEIKAKRGSIADTYLVGWIRPAAGSGARAAGPRPGRPKGMTLTSPAFESGEFMGPLPKRLDPECGRSSPPLAWQNLPDGTKELALIVEDLTQKRMDTNWVIYKIPVSAEGLPAGLAADERLKQPEGALQGKNATGTLGYDFLVNNHDERESPAVRDRIAYAWRIRFRLYALDAELDLAAGATCGELLTAMEGHVLGTADLIGKAAHTVVYDGSHTEAWPLEWVEE